MELATIGDYENVATGGICTHRFDVADVRICGSYTPPTLGIAGQILPRRSPRVAPTGVATSGWEVDVSPNTESSTSWALQEIANFMLPGGIIALLLRPSGKGGPPYQDPPLTRNGSR